MFVCCNFVSSVIPLIYVKLHVILYLAFFIKKRLKGEVNCSGPSPSVSTPCLHHKLLFVTKARRLYLEWSPIMVSSNEQTIRVGVLILS
jgi:hypothetical protein